MYVIAIPSYKRSMILLYKTLNFLERNSINSNLIYIFITEEDKDDYMQIPRYLYKELVIGVKGIVQQREFIENYFHEGDHIVSIDDDIQDLTFARQDEEIPLDCFLQNAFELCKNEGAFIWGVYPVGNAFYAMRNKFYTTHLTFICGCFYGFINRPNKEELKCILTNNKDDYERCIKYWYCDKVVVRFNSICVKTKYCGTDGGGLGRLSDRLVGMEQECKLLHAHYPTITKLRIKKTGEYDLKLCDHSGQTLCIKDKTVLNTTN